MVQHIDRPGVYTAKAHEEVDRWEGTCRALLAKHDGICAPLKLELGEGIGDGGTANREDTWARCGVVDFDGLEADDEGVVMGEVDSLYAVVRLGQGE